MFTTNRYRRRTVACALALKFAFWIEAVRAGSSDHERIVEVTLTEYQIDTVLEAGWTSLRIRNAGKKAHGLKLKGYGLETKLESELKPGQRAALQVDLKPGTYRVACPKDDHDDEKNIRLELRVDR